MEGHPLHLLKVALLPELFVLLLPSLEQLAGVLVDLGEYLLDFLFCGCAVDLR